MLGSVDRWAVVARLVKDMRANQGWAGETHVQKTMFFLQELLGVPSGFDFVLYKHGPYSFDLHDDLGRMLNNFVLDLEPRPPYGPSFGLDEIGDSIIQKRAHVVDEYEGKLSFVVDLLATRDVRELERLGTALLLKMEFPAFDPATLASKIVELKPHIPEDLAITAIREVAKIEEDAKAKNLIPG